jgi:hypothetical protein
VCFLLGRNLTFKYHSDEFHASEGSGVVGCVWRTNCFGDLSNLIFMIQVNTELHKPYVLV